MRLRAGRFVCAVFIVMETRYYPAPNPLRGTRLYIRRFQNCVVPIIVILLAKFL